MLDSVVLSPDTAADSVEIYGLPGSSYTEKFTPLSRVESFAFSRHCPKGEISTITGINADESVVLIPKDPAIPVLAKSFPNILIPKSNNKKMPAIPENTRAHFDCFDGLIGPTGVFDGRGVF